MALTAIVGGEVFTPDQRIPDGLILFEGPTILEVGSRTSIRVPDGADRIDAEGRIVAPGFIDLHTHGLLGHDVMGPGLGRAIPEYPRFGVTSFLATTFAAPLAAVHRALESMVAVLENPPPGARCLGVHLEGPHLSPEQAGAADPSVLHPLTWSEFEQLQSSADGRIAMLTFAPEAGGSLELIPRLVESGVIPAVGHSAARFELIRRAVDLGLSHASHTFNAMEDFHHRQPGLLGAVLHFDRIHAQLIADGVHVHPAAIQLLYRAKGAGRVLLVSDSSPFAQSEDGAYTWHGRELLVREGRCVLDDGTLAGSYAMLNVGVRTVVLDVGLPLEAALTSASATPARSLGLSRKGRLAPDFDADIAILSREFEPVQTYVEGAMVWSAEGL